MNPDYVLTEFLNRTGTGAITENEYWDSDILTLVRPHLLNVLPQLSEDLVKRWVWALLGAADVPQECQGILVGETVLRYVINWHLSFTLSPPPINAPFTIVSWQSNSLDPTIPHQVLDALFQVLRGLSPDRTARLEKSPPQREGEIWAYYLQSFPFENKRPSALFATCGIFLGLRLQLYHRNEPETLKWYATAARMLFKCFNHNRLTTPIQSLSRKDFLALVEWSLQALAGNLRRSNDPKVLCELYRVRLKRLFDGHQASKHPHAGPIRNGIKSPQSAIASFERRPLDDVPSGVVSDDPTVAPSNQLFIEEYVGYDQDDNDNIEGDTATQEHDLVTHCPAIYTLPPALDVVPRKPSLSAQDVSRFIAHQFPFWWDPLRGGLGPHRLIAWLRQIDTWLQAGIADGRLLVPPLSLYYGWNRFAITEIQIASYPIDDDAPATPRDRLLFDPHRWLFFYHQETQQGRSSFAPKSPDGWRHSTRWIALPVAFRLSPLLTTTLTFLDSHNALVEGAPLLQIRTTDETLTPLTPRRFQQIQHSILKKTQRDLPTPAALTRAFHPLITTLCGLDEVGARYLSRRTITRGFVQSHYTYLTFERFFQACYQAWDTLDKWLRGFME